MLTINMYNVLIKFFMHFDFFSSFLSFLPRKTYLNLISKFENRKSYKIIELNNIMYITHDLHIISKNHGRK
jgi:hypothetical protein